MSLNVIISGGGTGGHIFPMISIANELKNENKENEILFVGSRDRMEMEIVPKHNFKIIGLWISGIKRSSILLNILFAGIPFFLQNFLLPLKLLYSIFRSIYILYTFKPDFVIGFGGYSSGPFVFISNFLRFKTAIQEQNSSMGLTNKFLVNRVDHVFVAYEKLKKIYYQYYLFTPRIKWFNSKKRKKINNHLFYVVIMFVKHQSLILKN